MSKQKSKKRGGKYLFRPKQEGPSGWFALPFFLTLAVLTVVSFIIPLRPTQSYTEKRNLKEFPEFSLEALADGSYFGGITTWFSDTFPGREQWLQMSTNISSLHGYADISIQGDVSISDPIPEIPTPTKPTEPQQTDPTTGSDPTEPTPGESQDTTPTEPEDTTPTEPEGWGGVNAGEGAEISLGAVIQIGDSVFNQLGFSQVYSDRYSKTITDFAAAMEGKGVNVISAPCPTSVGIMVEPEYLAKLNCARQDQMIAYMHGSMSDQVIKVDTYQALVEHNDEYIYFHTDHHWTALGAYYSYAAMCREMGYEPAPLESFEVWNQGEFQGSVYWDATWIYKLAEDHVDAYVPQGNIEMMIYNNDGGAYEWPVISDMTQRTLGEKYLSFIGGDHPLVVITNNDLPDGPSCVIVKDSFGNCYAPFLTQNYHKVYVVDYRKYYKMNLQQFVDVYEIDDVIFMPYLIATQDPDGNNLFRRLCGV